MTPVATPAGSGDHPPVVMLLGPTASGKSACAMAIAQRHPVEIVSVDSAQVYRGMDIGTAKPSADEQSRVRHHLIDLIDPAQAYSAARFRTDAMAAIAQIRARGNLPLLVGGTMLYAKALLQGLHDLPPADPAVREQLNHDAARIGWPAMHARLAQVDPVTAARLPPGDSQRISRALEIRMITGQPMSALLAMAPPSVSGPGAPDTLPRFALIALEPSDRAVLHQRIADRFELMLGAGLVQEVARLHNRGDLHPALPSIRCVGYRQAWEHLEGRLSAAGLREQGIAATRQLAKRQLTWLRAMPSRQVIDALAPQVASQVVDRFAALNQRSA